MGTAAHYTTSRFLPTVSIRRGQKQNRNLEERERGKRCKRVLWRREKVNPWGNESRRLTCCVGFGGVRVFCFLLSPTTPINNRFFFPTAHRVRGGRVRFGPPSRFRISAAWPSRNIRPIDRSLGHQVFTGCSFITCVCCVCRSPAASLCWLIGGRLLSLSRETKRPLAKKSDAKNRLVNTARTSWMKPTAVPCH